ncbi:MAG: hypothetical protein IPG23_23370 [Burkholderiales bacterium]|jgi:hypothetical protein|nr:hypothetical protein [Burkholderiales bacterium]
MELAIQQFFNVGSCYWLYRQSALEFAYFGFMPIRRSPFWLEPAFQKDPLGSQTFACE